MASAAPSYQRSADDPAGCAGDTPPDGGRIDRPTADLHPHREKCGPRLQAVGNRARSPTEKTPSATWMRRGLPLQTTCRPSVEALADRPPVRSRGRVLRGGHVIACLRACEGLQLAGPDFSSHVLLGPSLFGGVAAAQGSACGLEQPLAAAVGGGLELVGPGRASEGGVVGAMGSSLSVLALLSACSGWSSGVLTRTTTRGYRPAKPPRQPP